jgi:hypothetical protein
MQVPSEPNRSNPDRISEEVMNVWEKIVLFIVLSKKWGSRCSNHSGDVAFRQIQAVMWSAAFFQFVNCSSFVL